MAMINIEYRHSEEPPEASIIRRKTVEEMKNYLMGLVAEMLIADISAQYVDAVSEGKNAVVINGKDVNDILNGLQIRMLDNEDACDSGKPSLIKFERPVLDWRREFIEDIPDVLMKNAISKAYADAAKDRIM
ncbi:MAG: hypothetical protein PHV81_04250 [Candidatus Methanomethylophilaceae archaeon]|jgi:hypothetical protein|nr:hypothetical protein [Candidatus Methanomethylophilaceae archaeon]NCA73769.1 hypothetical protein [Gammaproteobacteria bacterium]MDD2935665.1 hypothetical protein [Candidatus Methanomethylophilaceae archaeon]MDD3351959.1 hypothetical protein [Candidatus Methanomethylophilaceae archaeon]MDD3987058.1 hypothetical protein [Candidatus Methanomethylophilaceae archaeon]